MDVVWISFLFCIELVNTTLLFSFPAPYFYSWTTVALNDSEDKIILIYLLLEHRAAPHFILCLNLGSVEILMHLSFTSLWFLCSLEQVLLGPQVCRSLCCLLACSFMYGFMCQGVSCPGLMGGNFNTWQPSLTAAIKVTVRLLTLSQAYTIRYLDVQVFRSFFFRKM